MHRGQAAAHRARMAAAASPGSSAGDQRAEGAGAGEDRAVAWPAGSLCAHGPAARSPQFGTAARAAGGCGRHHRNRMPGNVESSSLVMSSVGSSALPGPSFGDSMFGILVTTAGLMIPRRPSATPAPARPRKRGLDAHLVTGTAGESGEQRAQAIAATDHTALVRAQRELTEMRAEACAEVKRLHTNSSGCSGAHGVARQRPAGGEDLGRRRGMEAMRRQRAAAGTSRGKSSRGLGLAVGSFGPLRPSRRRYAVVVGGGQPTRYDEPVGGRRVLVFRISALHMRRTVGVQPEALVVPPSPTRQP